MGAGFGLGGGRVRIRGGRVRIGGAGRVRGVRVGRVGVGGRTGAGWGGRRLGGAGRGPDGVRMGRGRRERGERGGDGR